ncbi:protein Shroom4-like isoform X1 [Acipenser ruthenus]|uniref:protein Shroom4-like isoform X1 n=2 Tax=Acipenser ruthenus TaxID=7906 RepID=UPI0027409D02|nr:protein Shroom4-like isoform X1 [Acipenser ruthenus]
MMDQSAETIDQLVSFQHIQVQLQGGAPWGFTLKGGLEHGEPLIVSKIEDGGKAALSKKLGVGDELVSINSSALYGSRQEALVLIKGSYRILKMVVRRRNVPVIRPHSWHLAKLSEHQPDSPAMQFHPGSFSLSWHSGCESSDLSMQWNQLSRHCSTDQSSSIGSMESLDPPSQGYYEGQLSPVDQSVFHNKRDSAYSSFSASSNTSDYTVSLKPDEASSMDNLHGLGPCRYAEGRCVPGVVESGGLSEDSKPCCLSQHSEVKGRPSSYSYGEDSSSSASKGPPPPPIRKESFKATRTGPGSADKRRASDPVHMLSQSGNWTSDTLLSNKPNCNPGCSKDARNLQQNSAVDQYYMLSSQLEQCKSCSPEAIPNEGYLNQHSTDASRQKNCSPCVPEEFGCLGGKSEALGKELSSDGPLVSTCLKKEHLMGHHGHRHSAPEKLVSSQMQSLNLSSRRDDSLEKPAPHDPYVWKGSPLHPQEAENLTSKEFSHPATKGYNAKWAESRCSTPGSVTASEIVKPRAEADTIDGHLDVGSCNNRTWGRCFSVPGEMPKPVPETLDLKNTGLTSASSVDTLLGEARTYEKSKPEVAAKPAASRQHRSSKARRRSERFATNLRNEIQRQKAQLQKSRGSSTLLYGEETVEEVNEQPEYDSPCSDSSPSSQGRESKLNKTTSPAEVHISRPDARSQEAILHETRSSPRHQKVHQNTSCRSPSPQQKGPQNISCRSPSPQQTGPQNISCRGPSPQLKLPQNTSCRSPSPQQIGPQNISCRGTSPQLKLPQNTSCRSPSPQQKGPQNISCRSPSPQQTGPQNVRCRSPSPQQTGPQNIRCRSPSPQQTGPQNIRCRSSSPQQKGPQNISCRSPSPQQTGPQNVRCRSPPQLKLPQNSRCRSPPLQQTGPQNFGSRFRETTHRTPSPEISEKKEDQTHGRGGRWKWTPEHKLQPQVKPEKENHSRTSDMVRPSKPAPTLASKESDILPFADRRKFFEETSKSLSSSYLPNLPVRHNKSDLSGKYLEKPNCNPNHSYCPGERKYSTGQTYHSHEVLSAFHPTELRPVEQQICCNQDKDEADLDHSCCYRIRASETVAHKPKAYFVSEDCRTLPHRHRQPCDHCLHPRNSDFYPTPVAVYEECASHHVYNPARKPLFETFPVEEQEQTKINRKASLTERDFQCCRNSCQLAARQPQDNFESRWIHHRAASSYDLSQDQHSTSWTTTPLEGHSEGFVKYPQRGRALSESNIRVDLQRLQRLHMREFGGPPALCELEEPRPREEEAGKKKGPPPPRPPPPNWEKYKHRRASHSALCSLPTSQRAPPLGYNSSPSDSSPPPCNLETSRQRSRSLPLRDPPENYLRCFHEPHGLLPANHRSALVPKTCNQLCGASRQDSSCELHGDPVPPRIPDALAVPAAAGLRSRRSETSVDKEAIGVPMYTHQKVMCHEKRSVYGNLLCFSIKPEKGSEGLAESYFAMNYEQNGDLCRRPEELKKAAPTTTRSILIQPEENILETNIDEYRQEDTLSEDLPACYQSPQETPTHLAVSVLETDIDTVPEEGEEPPQLEVVKAALVNLTPEELLRDIVSTDSSLAGILDPCSRVTAADLIEEIFPRSEENRPAEKRRSNRNVLQLNVDIQPERCSPLAPSPTPGPSVSPTSCSSYYSISAGKAELLNRVKELPGMEEEEEEDDELAFKKQQLIDSLSRKLSVLREAQQSLLEDIGANCTLGEEVESLVQTVCKPNELDKFCMFIGDLEKVVSLLLSLSGRLARVENALSGLGLEASHDERLALTEKKKQLSEQLGEARELKEHVDRRERVVLEVLSRYLTEEQLQDYRHFVKMKSGLIIEQRQLEEKIRLGEEQLRCLRESLGMGLAHC